MKITKSGSPTKPKNVGKINKELVQSTKKDPSLESLAGLLEKGHSVVLGDFEGDRKVSNFIATKYLGLDFDTDSVTIEGNLLKCEELEIEPAIVYPTFTATEEVEKHRIFIKLDREVDAREFKLLQLGLMKLFPDCDKACKESVRIFYGTNKPVQVIGGTVEVSHLLYLIKKYFYESTSTNKTTEIRAFAQQVGVEVINGQLALGMDIEDIKWTVTVQEAKGLTKQTRTGTTYKKASLVNKKVKRELRQINIEDLAIHFPLLKDFFEGKYWATYPELLMIASNLAFIEGGMKKFHETIESYSFYDNDSHDKLYYHIQADNFVNCYEDPKPMGFIGEFERYSEMGKNILTAYDKKQKTYVRIQEKKGEEEMMTVQEATDKLAEMIKTALKSDKKVTVINSPTALGKSYQLVNGIDYDALGKKTVIAFPTHKLKEEMVERFYEAFKFPAYTVKKPLHILPKEDRERVNLLYTAGDNEGAGKLFTKLVKQNGLTNDEEYQEYLLSIKGAKRAQVTLTTHELALSGHIYDIGADTLIIDEDCLTTMFNSCEVKFEDIQQLLSIVKQMPNSYYLQDWLTNILKLARKDTELQATSIIGRTGEKFIGAVHEIEAINFPVATILNRVKKLMLEGKVRFNSPVLNLFRVDSFWNLNTNYNKGTLAISDGIKLVTKPKLPNVDKIVILSATATKNVWHMVDEHIEFLELPKKVLPKGEVIQLLDNNTSKNKLPEHEDSIILEMRQIGVEVFITYKADKFLSSVEKSATFGATAGLDFLKGQDMAVIGTPNLPESEYNLQAFALSGSLPTSMNNRIVEANGFKFPLYTYEKGFYQDFQLYYITSELMQAVGRARTLRHDCKVYLHSHVPMDVDQHIYQGEVI